MTSRTRSVARKQASGSRAARGASQKGAKVRQTANKSSPGSDVPDIDTSGLSQSDAQALAKLLKKAKDAKKADTESRLKGIRKRASDMIRDEDSASDEERPKTKRKRTKGNQDSNYNDEVDNDAAEVKGSVEEDEDPAVADERDGSEREGSQESKEPDVSDGIEEKEVRSRPKPRPAYRGAQQPPRKPVSLEKEEANIAKSLSATSASKSKKKARAIGEKSGEDHEEVEEVVPRPKKSTLSSSSAKQTKPSIAPPSPSFPKRKVYINIPVSPKSPVRGSTSKSAAKVNDKSAAAKANDKGGAKTKATRRRSDSNTDDTDADLRKSDQDESDDDDGDDGDDGDFGSNGGKGGSEDEEDEDELKGEDDNGVVILPGRQGKGQKNSKGRGRKERAKVTNLPIDVRVLVTAAQNCLRLRISLKTAWTSESVHDAHEMRDKEGKRIKALKVAFEMIRTKREDEKDEKEMLEEEKEEERKRLALQQDVYTVVWASASQFRNELKKKAKVVVDQMYGLQGLSPEQRSSVAAWLLRTHSTDVLDGGSRNIPNFVFSDINLVFDGGKHGKKLDLKATTFNEDEPFRHEVIAELIYQHWALGARADANLHAAMDDFRKVPDNLIAVVCNTIDSALTEVVTHGMANFFTNKLFAAKWDGLMAILETLKNEAPEHYRETKAIIWAQISGRLKANTIDEEDSDDTKGTSFLKFDRLRAKVGKTSPVRERARATSISTTQPASSKSSLKKSGGLGKPSSSSSMPASGKATKSVPVNDHEVDELDKEEGAGSVESHVAPHPSGGNVTEPSDEQEREQGTKDHDKQAPSAEANI
ncbi:uncharacterized protein B0H18DRAFT_1124470 [Fomitopsis serialis]|uniref:uncharacterized protein n=1 Tax=Fomitopsis serialis TaxID=139415 RepID=UPI00200799B0|nr:uncharacterized protein B0H18DRAFT_1124470 [Neoantrodia serialis]KAH9916069.1 hypothetical protein B0H18DRAFT_1124470 [Neoantrodia serialis]